MQLINPSHDREIGCTNGLEQIIDAAPLRSWAKRTGQKIVDQRQLANLGVQRFHIDRFFNDAASFGSENPGSPFEKLAPPLRVLIGMNVKLLRQIRQRLFALTGASATFALNAGL